MNHTSDNRIKILITVTAITLVIAVAAIAAVLISGMLSGGNGDTGERINGDYSISVSSGSFAMAGGYSFDGSDNATETYTENGEIVTNEYTYIMTLEGNTKYIVFTRVGGEDDGKVSKHEFYSGTLTDEFGVVHEFISINETYYYKSAD